MTCKLVPRARTLRSNGVKQSTFRARTHPPEVPALDAAVMPVLARIGLTALPPGLRQRVEQLDGADEALAAAVRADVERMAALLVPR